MVHRQALIAYIDERLSAQGISDYCPNGLQVEGRAEIKKLVVGVTASQRFLRAALNAGADAVLVHHGYFWKSESAVVTGMKAERLRLLLNNDVNLLAYHLPLDVHPTLGNNAQLAQLLGIDVAGTVTAGGIPGLLWHGDLAKAQSVAQLAKMLSQSLDHSPVVVEGGSHPVRRVAWCSGGGQRFIVEAARLGVDAYISGEISEPTAHEARELGIHYLAAGHHATERGGVQALGRHLAEHFGLAVEFIDDPNPA